MPEHEGQQKSASPRVPPVVTVTQTLSLGAWTDCTVSFAARLNLLRLLPSLLLLFAMLSKSPNMRLSCLPVATLAFALQLSSGGRALIHSNNTLDIISTARAASPPSR